jgi:hypothetical protein
VAYTVGLAKTGGACTDWQSTIDSLELDISTAFVFDGTDGYPPFGDGGTDGHLRINNFALVGYPTVEEITLATTATSTVVTSNKAAAKWGTTCGAVLDIMPSDSAARGLVAAGGGFSYALTAASAGGGYTIYHPLTGGGTYKVVVRHRGYVAPFVGA